MIKCFSNYIILNIILNSVKINPSTLRVENGRLTLKTWTKHKFFYYRFGLVKKNDINFTCDWLPSSRDGGKE